MQLKRERVCLPCWHSVYFSSNFPANSRNSHHPHTTAYSTVNEPKQPMHRRDSKSGISRVSHLSQTTKNNLNQAPGNSPNNPNDSTTRSLPLKLHDNHETFTNPRLPAKNTSEGSEGSSQSHCYPDGGVLLHTVEQQLRQYVYLHSTYIYIYT